MLRFCKDSRHLPFGSRRCPGGHGNSGTVIILNGDIVIGASVDDSVCSLFAGDDKTTVITVAAIINNAIENFILDFRHRM